MAIEVAGVFPRDGYVEVVLKGPYTTAEFPWAYDQVLRAVERRPDARVLLNLLAVEGLPSVIDRFLFGQTASLTLPRTLKLAAVATEPILDPQRFGERVAQNRGAWVRVFGNAAEAVEWLLADTEPPPPI